MKINSDRLNGLIRRLDGLGSKPSLIDLAASLDEARITHADISDFIQVNPHNYNRTTVVLRDNYELLVMTWQGGQSSVPHDHGGSICAMLTVQGVAAEGNYSVAPDGYVDLEYQNFYHASEVIAGEDAAVHTISNPQDVGDLLVTVHIYSPPLRDFRRFSARPAAIDRPLQIATQIPTVAIVGGGFSGSISAAQILRQVKTTLCAMRVLLIEQRGSIGEGLAYSTRENCHLLNVPAGRMSAWPDQPGDFVKWASATHGAVSPDDFLPRQWYGEYIRQTVMRAASEAGDATDFAVVFDEVRRIARHPDGGWLLNLARGTPVRADAVLLGIGHRAPNDPLVKKWTGARTRFIADPWKTFAMNAVPSDESVVILGSGLTAVDAVMSLVNRGHRGQITLVSRRGMVPQPHLPGHGTPVDLNPLVLELTRTGPLKVRTLFRRLRERAATAKTEGVPWQSVIDGLRPHIATLWASMPTGERRRFLSRLRPLWEVHRHRMPVPVARRFAALLASGSVRVLAGRADAVIATTDELRFTVLEKQTGAVTELKCGWIVNATGPSPSNSAAANPAIGSLLVQGLLSVDELRLGVQTTSNGNAIGSNGEPVKNLFVVGTLRKPELWESTAVPELRSQAAEAAARIVADLVTTAVH